MYSRVDVTVASKQSGLHCFADLIGLGLPSSQTKSWDLVACVEGESFSAPLVLVAILGRLQKRFGITRTWYAASQTFCDIGKLER